MAVPKKKTTRSKRGTRRAHLAFRSLGLSICPQCKQPLLPHTICQNCGYYKGKQVIEVGKRKKKEKKRAK